MGNGNCVHGYELPAPIFTDVLCYWVNCIRVHTGLKSKYETQGVLYSVVAYIFMGVIVDYGNNGDKWIT